MSGCSRQVVASDPGPTRVAPAPATPAAITAYAHFGDSVTVAPGAPAGDTFTLLWAGVPSATYTQTGIPHLIVGGILTENFGLRTDVTALYNGIVQTVVSGLKADGLDVQFAATHTVLTAPDDYVDILHPNDAGHKKIAAAFLNPQ